MHKQIFVNLAVEDLPRSKTFFEALGLAFNPQFTNEQGACLVLGENIFAMLLSREFFKTFIDKEIADARRTTEVLTCLSCDSRAEVDTVVANAVKAGGKAHRQPQDHGFMYAHGFEDLDGHIWELAYMDMSALPPQ
ncbi:MAG: VOC family protein [Rhizobiales bacterium]|nr:VOC family protein [Rhizobacter sp.]